MLFEHGAVVHSIDVIPGEYQDEPSTQIFDDLKIAVHRVRRAPIA